MTLKDLKKRLKKLDDNLIVWLEGCDCYGRWNGKFEKIGDKEILLKRNK